MYIATTVAKPAGISPGSASPKKANVTIFDMDDVAFFPSRDSKGIVIVDNILMKPGKKMIQIYSTRSKISAPYESDGDEDSINVKPTVDIQHPGNKREFREFIQNWLGKNVGLILETCDGQKELVGTPCAPLQFKPSKQDNNDGLFHMLKFESFASSNLLPALYEGALTLTSSVVTNGELGIQLLKNTTVVAGAPATVASVSMEFTDSGEMEHGTAVTIVGLGGTAPFNNLLDDGVAGAVTLLLKDSATWVALQGAFINFKYFKSGTINYLIEQSRG